MWSTDVLGQLSFLSAREGYSPAWSPRAPRPRRGAGNAATRPSSRRSHDGTQNGSPGRRVPRAAGPKRWDGSPAGPSSFIAQRLAFGRRPPRDVRLPRSVPRDSGAGKSLAWALAPADDGRLVNRTAPGCCCATTPTSRGVPERHRASRGARPGGPGLPRRFRSRPEEMRCTAHGWRGRCSTSPLLRSNRPDGFPMATSPPECVRMSGVWPAWRAVDPHRSDGRRRRRSPRRAGVDGGRGNDAQETDAAYVGVPHLRPPRP